MYNVIPTVVVPSARGERALHTVEYYFAKTICNLRESQ